MLNVYSEKAITIMPGDLDYFQEHFVGEKLPDTWTFSNIEICKKSYPVRNFIGWMLQVPVVTEKTKDVLYPLISPYVQFLYMTTIKKKKLYAINVLQLENCLDLEKSDVIYSSDDPERIINVGKVVFNKSKIPSFPIFKLNPYIGKIFVDENFVKLVIDNKLKGAHFVEPSDDLWYLKKPNECGIVT